VEQVYTCTVCGYTSSDRAEFVEYQDPVKLPRVLEKARARGRVAEVTDVKYLCLKCSVELYQEEVKAPRVVRAVCPRCGEVVEVWV